MNILELAILKQMVGGGGGSGTDNYNDLSNLPQINGETLAGNKSSSNLGLQDEIDSDNKLASDLVDDSESTNKFVTSTEKNTWNAKQNAIDSDHKLSSDLVDDANKTNKFVTSTEKNTWNAKQNAIDADHKLSSSLVSFTTAEAAALASGIDSGKVGQISTNQTNILLVKDATEELVDNGAKNLLNSDDYIRLSNLMSYSNGTCTVQQQEGDTLTNLRFRLRGYETTSSTAPVYSTSNIEVSENGKFFFTFTKSNEWSMARIMHSAKSSDLAADVYIAYDFSDLPDGDYVFACNVTNCVKSVGAYTWNSMVVCTKAEWEISQKLTDYALPNYDLTYREQRDRDALVEVIDKGAKNLFDNANGEGTSHGTSVTTWDSATGTATQVLTDTKTNLSLKLEGRSGSSGTWTGIFVNIDVTSNGVVSIPFTAPINTTELQFGHNGSTADALVVLKNCVLKAGKKYYIQCNVINCVQASGAYSWKDIMVCDAPLFDISPAYEPYALPNTDLTKAVTTKAPALSRSTAIDSGSLDDVAENTFAVYASTVANVPTSDDYYVETIVYDVSNALQKAYNYTDGTSYVRVKNAATWGNWKQITNA